MKRCLLLVALLAVSLAARGQNSRGDFSLTTATGQAVSGASVYVLQQPANTSSFTPTISIFGSPSGSGTAVCGASAGSISDPLITDQFGHACGYFAPGTYTVCYVSTLAGTQCYQDQLFNGASGGSVINASTMTAFQLNNEFWVAGAAVGSTLLCPNGGTTQLECAANAANAWSNANSANTMLHLMPGVNTTNLGLSFTSTYAPSIVGAATYGSLIRQISTIATPTVNYGCNVFASSVTLKDFTIDADFNAPSGLYIGKSQEHNSDGLTVIGANGSGANSNFVQIGDPTCGGGGGATFEGQFNHLTISGRGTGPTTWVQATCSQSGGTPSCSISNGGSYHWPTSTAYLVGYQNGTSKQACTTMGTVTPVFTINGTWVWGGPYYSQTLNTYTLSSVSFSGFSGCAGSLYLFVPDELPPAYGVYLPFATDSVFNMLVVAGAGQTAGVANQNGANVFNGLHVYNNYVGYKAAGGGGHIYGYDCDSNLIMMQVTGAVPLKESGCTIFYPSATASIYRGAVMADVSADASQQSTFVQNDFVGTPPTDWHPFLMPTGPSDQGGGWPGSFIDVDSPNLNPFGNVRHDTSMQAVTDNFGSEIPATSGANQVGPLRRSCYNVWNGSTSQQNCWIFQVGASSTGVPTQEIFNVIPPSNALAPVSGRFWLWNSPGNASGGGNVNSITIGPRGSYWNGSVANSIGWNWITQIGAGTTPSNTFSITPTSCPGTCQISTNANIATTGTTKISSPTLELTNSGFGGDFTPSTFTATRTYTLPDASGAVPVAPGAVTVGNAACWKANGQLGTCSTTPTGGVCTCN